MITDRTLQYEGIKLDNRQKIHHDLTALQYKEITKEDMLKNFDIQGSRVKGFDYYQREEILNKVITELFTDKNYITIDYSTYGSISIENNIERVVNLLDNLRIKNIRDFGEDYIAMKIEYNRVQKETQRHNKQIEKKEKSRNYKIKYEGINK